MSLKLSRADGTEGVNALAGSVIAALTVVLANQGHVGRNSFPVEEFPNGFGGETMYQVFLCDAGGKICGEACMASVNEGNKFDVLSNDGETLIIRLSSLVVGQGQDCGGYTDIASLPGRPIDFVLARVEDSICKDSLEK